MTIEDRIREAVGHLASEIARAVKEELRADDVVLKETE